jgi:hypothetical protein
MDANPGTELILLREHVEFSKTQSPRAEMWQFNWGVFWAVLAAILVNVGIIGAFSKLGARVSRGSRPGSILTRQLANAVSISVPTDPYLNSWCMPWGLER